MFRVPFLLIILGKLYATEKSYFEQRKEMLKNQKFHLYPRPARTNIIQFYYGPAYYETKKLRPTEFETIINEENLCSQYEKVFLIIHVRTFYQHHVQRRVFRDLMDLYNMQEPRMRVKHSFLFGLSRNETVNKLIKEESLLYGDILQESYIEHYANLTLKTLQAWKWSLNFCPNAEYVMVMNDELFLDLIKIVKHLFNDYLSFKHDDHFALCQIIGNHRVDHMYAPVMKDMDPEELYKGNMLPPFCHGYGYAAHITVINKLYFASQINPYFMPDDTWLGVLTEKLRLKMVNHRRKYGVTTRVVHIFSHPSYLASPVMIGVTDLGRNKKHPEQILQKLFSILEAQYEKLEKSKDELLPSNHYNSSDETPLPKPNQNNSIFYIFLTSVVSIFIVVKLFYRICKCFGRFLK